ncbi:hypothetical protein R1flu_027500 [Riccia fluitans]|uniref:Uncharacterized protein n=1 Tax=Riccia fluitans TaxID=41844 RepID=A0ABD1XJ10_9MARC
MWGRKAGCQPTGRPTRPVRSSLSVSSIRRASDAPAGNRLVRPTMRVLAWKMRRSLAIEGISSFLSHRKTRLLGGDSFDLFVCRRERFKKKKRNERMISRRAMRVHRRGARC